MIFGGDWAFPGGKLEPQDSLERCVKVGLVTEREANKFHDFDKRAAAIRETFEETNLLMHDSLG